MKVNKNTETVFLDIPDNNNKVGKYHKFIKKGNFMDPNENKYKDLVDSILPTLNELIALEEIILQTRACDNLSFEDIKVIKNNGYVYVRVPFYRKNNVAKEIRALVGKESDWEFIGGPEFHENKEFLAVAHNALTRVMKDVLHQNVEAYRNKFKKEKVKQ